MRRPLWSSWEKVILMTSSNSHPQLLWIVLLALCATFKFVHSYSCNATVVQFQRLHC